MTLHQPHVYFIFIITTQRIVNHTWEDCVREKSSSIKSLFHNRWLYYLSCLWEMMKRRLITSHTVPSMTGQCTWLHFTPLRRKLYSSLTQKDMKELWRKFMECQAMISRPFLRLKTIDPKNQKTLSNLPCFHLGSSCSWSQQAISSFLAFMPQWHLLSSSPTETQSPIGLCRVKKQYVICN